MLIMSQKGVGGGMGCLEIIDYKANVKAILYHKEIILMGKCR